MQVCLEYYKVFVWEVLLNYRYPNGYAYSCMWCISLSLYFKVWWDMFAHICSILIALRSSGGNCLSYSSGCALFCCLFVFFFKSTFVPPSTFPSRSGDNEHEVPWVSVQTSLLTLGEGCLATLAFSSVLLLAKPVKNKYGDANTYWNWEVWWQCSSCLPLPQHWEQLLWTLVICLLLYAIRLVGAW